MQQCWTKRGRNACDDCPRSEEHDTPHPFGPHCISATALTGTDGRRQLLAWAPAQLTYCYLRKLTITCHSPTQHCAPRGSGSW
jgi:hypothetical protein